MKSSTTALRLLLGAAALLTYPTLSADAQFSRVVLLEELTSVTCDPCATAGQIINEIASENPTRVATVRYHTFFLPPPDPFYEANRPESDARRAFYSVAGIPVVRVDGSLEPTATNETEVRDRVTGQLAEESPIRLDVTQTVSDANQVQIQVVATAGPDGLGAGFKLRVAAVEAFIHDGRFVQPTYNGEVDLHDVFRDMLPNADGESIELGPNETKTFTYSYDLGLGWQVSQMYAIAFVQEDFDKTVVQTGFSPRPVAGIDDAAVAGYSARSAAPNPTVGDLRVDFTLGRAGRLDASVVDGSGAVVASIDAGVREAGDGTLTLDLGALPAGVYTCALRSGAWRWSERVVVVR
jgi:hypothetical protein